MSRADIPGVPAVHMKWTPDTPPEGRVVVFRFISYKKEGLHAAMGGGTLQNYLDLHQNDTNSAECARSLGNGKFYPKVQYFTVPRKTNFLQRVRNTVCAFSVSASMAYHKARFILQCLLARD